MARHSISEAAKLTGKARSTLHKHIKEGRISKEIGKDGKPYIETVELVRAYGTLHDKSDTATVQKQQVRTHEKDTSNSALWDEVEALRQEKLEKFETRIAELVSERDEWRRQATGLLTDQRQKPPQKAPERRLSRAWGSFDRESLKCFLWASERKGGYWKSQT